MPYPADVNALSPLQGALIGTWENRTFPGSDKGGSDNPLSYNIMPMPQDSDPNGYILKNFKYSERLKFNDNNADSTLAIAAIAPNRGGRISQNCRAVFYEQQVRFSEGPQGPGGSMAGDSTNGDVVHVENGAWLWLPRFLQKDGPYNPDFDSDRVSPALEQPTSIMIAKQISVPHGNSILALGSYDTLQDDNGTCNENAIISGSPIIPDASAPYPVLAEPGRAEDIAALNADARYSTTAASDADFQNPHPELTMCPNKPLQDAVAIIQPDRYMHWRVTTRPFQEEIRGYVVNIPFEEQESEVTDYYADYWLMYKTIGPFIATKAGTHKQIDVKDFHDLPELRDPTLVPKPGIPFYFTRMYLAYTQTILMRVEIGGIYYTMPHVTCNTVTKV